jgi:hypothetical protein
MTAEKATITFESPDKRDSCILLTSNLHRCKQQKQHDPCVRQRVQSQKSMIHFHFKRRESDELLFVVNEYRGILFFVHFSFVKCALSLSLLPSFS